MRDSPEPPPSSTFLNAYLIRLLSCAPSLLYWFNRQNCFLPTDVKFHKSFDHGFVLSTAEVTCFVCRHPRRWHYFGRNCIVVHTRVPSWTQVTLRCYCSFFGLRKGRKLDLYLCTLPRWRLQRTIRLFVFLTEYRFVPLWGKFNCLPSHGTGIRLT